MPTRKRSESSIVTACCNYLQVLMNNKKIAWFSRLQSGAIGFGYGKNRRFVRLCKAGTPDIMVILDNGFVWWFECKTDVGKQSKEQIEFFEMVCHWHRHAYQIVRSTDDLTFLNG